MINLKKALLIAGTVIAMTLGGTPVASAGIFCWPGSYWSFEYGQCRPDSFGGWGGYGGGYGHGGDYGHHGGWGGVGGHGGHGGGHH
jgi:hypothetical protein